MLSFRLMAGLPKHSSSRLEFRVLELGAGKRTPKLGSALAYKLFGPSKL